MSHALIIVTIGTVALATFASMLFVIAHAHHNYGRYGREALAVAGALLLSYIPTRLLLFTGHISSEVALQANSIGAIIATVILAEIIVLRHVERNGTPTKGTP